MEFQFEIASELRLELLLERWIRIETRDLIFILVRHQFVEVSCNQTREPTAASLLSHLRSLESRDRISILIGVSLVLVGDQLLSETLNQSVQRLLFVFCL